MSGESTRLKKESGPAKIFKFKHFTSKLALSFYGIVLVYAIDYAFFFTYVIIIRFSKLFSVKFKFVSHKLILVIPSPHLRLFVNQEKRNTISFWLFSDWSKYGDWSTTIG